MDVLYLVQYLVLCAGWLSDGSKYVVRFRPVFIERLCLFAWIYAGSEAFSVPHSLPVTLEDLEFASLVIANVQVQQCSLNALGSMF